MNDRLKSWLLASLIAIPFCTAFFIAAEGTADSTYGAFYSAQYIKNYDGDTITFNIPNVHPVIGDNISIRVRGIDTPEMRGKCEKEKLLANEAKVLVEQVLTKHKSVTLLNVGRGKYFRLVADVVADGNDIATILLENDLAVRYDGGTKVKNWCE